jgi:aminoglycoside/choline kinase family phosphotransferase
MQIHHPDFDCDWHPPAPGPAGAPAPALAALAENELGCGLAWQPLAGGSSRKKFWRITRSQRSWIGIDGTGLESYRLPENHAFESIGHHLADKHIPVPTIIAGSGPSGVFIVEDLGDNRLSEAARAMAAENRWKVYTQIIAALIQMQTQGTQGFDVRWCSQTTHYDAAMIMKYETTYFTDRFVVEYFGHPVLSSDLMAEFEQLASTAADIRPLVFLHRDFQSHNIMLHRNQIRIIDYQGGRLGPPGYDLASLLFDPFAGLLPEEQDALQQHYTHLAMQAGLIDAQRFENAYPYLLVHRMFQTIGAFAWLSKVRGRSSYATYLADSLSALQRAIAHSVFDPFPKVRKLIQALTV